MMDGKKCGGKCCGAWIMWILVVIGALNWGLVGLGGFFGGDWNVVGMIFGNVSWLLNLVYLLVGLAGLGMLFGGCKCKKCKMNMPASGGNMGGGQPSQM